MFYPLCNQVFSLDFFETNVAKAGEHAWCSVQFVCLSRTLKYTHFFVLSRITCQNFLTKFAANDTKASFELDRQGPPVIDSSSSGCSGTNFI